MSLINGLTSILKGSGNDSIDGINVYVTNSTAIPVEDENLKTFLQNQGLNISSGQASGSSSINVKMDPKPSDFTSMKSLNEIVPNGFILIHNDIEALKKAMGSGGSSAASSLLSSLTSGGIGGLVGGAVAGLAQGLFTGFIGDKTTDHMASIIDELNMDLTADDFRDDPEVEAAQHDAFIQYLKVYYLEQTAAMGGKAAGSFVSEALSTAITGTIGKLASAISGKEDQKSPGKLADIANKIDEGLTYEKVISDEGTLAEIEEVQKKAVIQYLKLYYAAQESEMAGKTVGNFVGSTIGSAIEGIFSGLIGGVFGSFAKLLGNDTEYQEAQAGTLESVAQKLTSNIDIDELSKDEEILDIQKESVKDYLEVFYDSMTSELRSESVGNQIGETLSSTITSFFGGLFEGVASLFGKKDEPDPNSFQGKMQTIITNLITSINTSELSEDEGLIDIQKTAVEDYVSTYFQLQSSVIKGNEAYGIAGILSDVPKDITDSIKDSLIDVFQSETVQANLVSSITSGITFKPLDYLEINVDAERQSVLRDTLIAIFDREKELLTSPLSSIRMTGEQTNQLKSALSTILQKNIDSDIEGLTSYTDSLNGDNFKLSGDSMGSAVTDIRGYTSNIYNQLLLINAQLVKANAALATIPGGTTIIPISTGEESDEALLG